MASEKTCRLTGAAWIAAAICLLCICTPLLFGCAGAAPVASGNGEGPSSVIPIDKPIDEEGASAVGGTAAQSESASVEAQSDNGASAEEVSETEDEQPEHSSTAAGKSDRTRLAEQAAARLIGGYGESVAVSMLPLDGTEGFSINGGSRFASASMIKLLILACLMEEVSEGSLSLEETYVLTAQDAVGGTGNIGSLPEGTGLSVGELAEAMIANSDNTATNILIGKIGMDAINAEARALGLGQTVLQRKMMDFNSGLENYMSADDAATILHGFAIGGIGNPAACEQAVGYLVRQTDNAAITQGLPVGVAFAHKTGSLDAIRHDGGIVYAANPYVIVVFTTLGQAAADDLMASLSEVVYEAMES